MKYEDLPDADRRAVDRALGRGAKHERKRPRPSRAEATPEAGEVDPGGSCSCGIRFDTYKAWEKHRAANQTTEHMRWNIAVTTAL